MTAGIRHICNLSIVFTKVYELHLLKVCIYSKNCHLNAFC